jgi:hypothetical protein
MSWLVVMGWMTMLGLTGLAVAVAVAVVFLARR